MFRQRILKENQQAIQNQNDNQFFLKMHPQNINNWNGYIVGPKESPYQHGVFELSIYLTSEYPLKPPKIKFVTKIFHPNVKFDTGEICLEVLQDQWTPQWTLESLMRAIIILMLNPNADSPLNCDCGNMIRGGDMLAYNTMASMYTSEYALPLSELKQFNIN